MYGALFRKLPGGPVAKTFFFTGIIVVVICLLIFVVFPFVESLIAEDPSLNA